MNFFNAHFYYYYSGTQLLAPNRCVARQKEMTS